MSKTKAKKQAKTKPAKKVAAKKSTAKTLAPSASAHRGVAQLVALKDLAPSKNNVRRAINQQTVKELAASILSIGVLSALTVQKTGSSYTVITGMHRWHALQSLQKDGLIGSDLP